MLAASNLTTYELVLQFYEAVLRLHTEAVSHERDFETEYEQMQAQSEVVSKIEVLGGEIHDYLHIHINHKPVVADVSIHVFDPTRDSTFPVRGITQSQTFDFESLASNNLSEVLAFVQQWTEKHQVYLQRGLGGIKVTIESYTPYPDR